MLREWQQDDPEVLRAASLESEPYSCCDSEIPCFESMLTGFADTFQGLPSGSLYLLISYIQWDEQGVLFWA